MNALLKLTQRGDAEYEHFIVAGGVGVFVNLMNQHMRDHENDDLLLESLHFVGEISANSHLRTVLGIIILNN